jgi:gamma-glutamyl:cysteine ligase YbdK (ATP-grasp superfamily)
MNPPVQSDPASERELDAVLDPIYQRLATRFASSFPQELSGARTVGREAEFPIVGQRGEAVDVRRLWNVLLEADDLAPEYGVGAGGHAPFIVGLAGVDYSFALEVGLGTIEISTRPCRTLVEIETVIQVAVARLVRAASRFGWRVLGYGTQPVSPPTIGLMSPKQRYLSLYRAMGSPWLWYTVTASDQLQFSIRRDEMLHMLNYGNLVAPVIIALCANSPIYGGKDSLFCSAREGVMAEIRAGEHRHGMPPAPYTSLYDFVCTLAKPTYLIVREGGEIVPSSRPFYAYLAENGPDFQAFLFHEHYIWNSARLRAAYGTLEVRPACQQPWPETMASAALILGLAEASYSILPYIEGTLGEDYWQRMRTYHQQAIRYGLRAPQPAPHFLEHIVAQAAAGLHARGFGEERLLAPIQSRLERHLNPAQRARAIFRSDGMAAMVDAMAIRL